MVAKQVCNRFVIRDEMKPIYNDIFNWCIMDYNGVLDPDKGLWLYGNIGTGKSTLLEIIKRFSSLYRPWMLPDGKVIPFSFRISNTIEVCAEYSRAGYEGIATFIDSSRQAFDELGSEAIPTGHFGTAENVMQYILQRRYDRRHESITMVTTNITKDEIMKRYSPRIYDRCKELFNFVEIPGKTFRKL